MYNAVCFGEVLWDVFPTYKNIGGAPLNVALRLQSFGVNSAIISRIGDDKNGKEILQYINAKGVDTANIQLDKINETGRVKVILDKDGSAHYEIEYPVAWDRIEVTEKVVETVSSADAFIFGSLACRDDITKKTLLELLQYSNNKVFDVNLRPPFYSMELLVDLMNKSDFIKCNDEELIEICDALNFSSESIMEQIEFLAQQTETEQICVTRGKEGAILMHSGHFLENNGYPVQVADTVGAGDSFLATLISQLLYKKDAEEALNYACAVGALVASKEGANPELDNTDIHNIISASK
jgi:fructokinase